MRLSFRRFVAPAACVIALFVASPAALGVPATWSQIGSHQPNNFVHALDVEGGTLWAGGSFTQLPYQTPRAGVAQWDGSSWSSAGAGTDSNVFAIEATPSGTVYAGGEFMSAGGGAPGTRMLAQWDGSSWSSVGSASGASNVVKTAVWSAGTLYIGGVFDDVGSPYIPATKIAKWNGTSWSAVGTPWGSDQTQAVNAVAVDGSGDVYAGGDFTTAGGAPADYLAKWNGTSWSAVGGGVDGAVNALALDGSGNVYVGGAFTTAGGVTVNRLAKWDGSSWSALGTGANSTVNALETVEYCGQTVLYAGGAFTNAGGAAANRVAAWDGAQWSPVGGGLGTAGQVFALAASGPGALYAGGSFDLPMVLTYLGQADVTNRACAPSSATAASTTPEEAMVSWTNPVSVPGWDEMVVTASPGGRTCSTPTGTTCTVTGLTNGTAYTFTVKAVNGAGDSPSSNTTGSVTPAAPPTAPTGVTAVAGQEQATVSWTVPAADGGSSILGYTATASPGGRTCTTTGAITCTVTGLTAGTGYTFTVTAANRAGSSGASGASDAVTPTAPPAAAPASVPASAPASAPRAPALGVSVRVRRGTATSTGTVPNGAASITQTARSGGSAAGQRFLMLAGARAKAVTGRCTITKRKYKCTIRLGKGTWSLTTMARGKTGVVAESNRSVVIR